MIERIVHQNKELALIVRRSFSAPGIEFFTPGSYSQQLGYMNRPAGHVIPPHVHRQAAQRAELQARLPAHSLNHSA